MVMIIGMRQAPGPGIKCLTVAHRCRWCAPAPARQLPRAVTHPAPLCLTNLPRSFPSTVAEVEEGVVNGGLEAVEEPELEAPLTKQASSSSAADHAPGGKKKKKGGAKAAAAHADEEAEEEEKPKEADDEEEAAAPKEASKPQRQSSPQKSRQDSAGSRSGAAMANPLGASKGSLMAMAAAVNPDAELVRASDPLNEVRRAGGGSGEEEGGGGVVSVCSHAWSAGCQRSTRLRRRPTRSRNAPTSPARSAPPPSA
jgi:hypothetical protein